MKVVFDISPAVAADDGRLPADTPLRARVEHALRNVFDPELPVNIVDLGLIYTMKVGADGAVDVEMTLTTPNCPVAGEMPEMVRQAALGVEGVTACAVRLVWDPPWDKTRMSEAARLELGLF